MSGIGIDNWMERKFTWYSLRHFGITMRIKAGVNIVDLAKMTLASVMKNFKISKEGISA